MEDKNQELIHDEMSEIIIESAENIALSQGVESLTVRKILQTLGITNRVFYNRFHNISEVLNIVYKNIALKMRSSTLSEFDPNGDFFAQIIDIGASTLITSYKIKMNFNYYIFENDSITNQNYEWWKGEIEKFIEFGKEKGYVKNIDSDIMSYAIWCFIRGYNADALGRKLPMEEAVNNFKYSFGVLLDGMKA